MKAIRISEHDEQANFFFTVGVTYRQRADFIGKLLFSVPNGMWIGGSNPYAMMNKFKAEGLQPGVADILYLQPRGVYNCLAIEMKAQDKRNDKDAVKPEQAEFLEAVNASGGWADVCYGCEEALQVFEVYMRMEAK